MATCTQCGAELKPGAKFCENCGAKVSVPQPAAQPAAVPQPPVQPTQAAPPPPQPVQTPPQPAGKRRQSLCRRRTCRPAAPDERSESLRSNAPAHRRRPRRHTAYARNTPPDAPHAVTPPPPGGTGGNPYGNVAPGGKPKRPRAPMTPKRMILIAIPVIFLLMIIVTMISGSIRTGKPNASDPNQALGKQPTPRSAAP